MYGLFATSSLFFIIALVIIFIDCLPFMYTALKSNIATAQMEAPMRIIKIAVWAAFISVFFSVHVSSISRSNGMDTISTLSDSEATIDLVIMLYAFLRVNKGT